MAEQDIEALAQAAKAEPHSRGFLTWNGLDRLMLALVFTDICGGPGFLDSGIS